MDVGISNNWQPSDVFSLKELLGYKEETSIKRLRKKGGTNC